MPEAALEFAAGLAVVNPAWMRFAAKVRPGRFAQFARRVFGLADAGKDDPRLAMEGIDRFKAFLGAFGCPTRLSELASATRCLRDVPGMRPWFRATKTAIFSAVRP